MLDSAIAFAALAHAGQRRKYTNEPYIVHPIEVMTILHQYFPDREDMLTAAVLHDVLEDTLVAERDIQRRFGPTVLRLVVGMTEVSIAGNRAKRKAAEVERLASEPAEVHSIKLADLISNSRTIVPHDPNFAKIYLAEKRTLWEVLLGGHSALREQADQVLKEHGF